jgi:DNA modification methylase
MKYFNRDAHRAKINNGKVRPSGSKKPEFLPEDKYINKIIHGDCLEKLKGIPDNSVDFVCSDLPYGMKKAEWDKIPTAETLMECNRVLKDGGFFVGFAYSWGNLLEQHLGNLRAAGFETNFTPLFWVHDNNRPGPSYIKKNIEKVKGIGFADYYTGACANYRPCTVVDVIIVAQKPRKEKSAYLQAIANGKGFTWLDKGRIPKYENGVPKLGESGYLASNIIVSDNALGEHSKKYDLHRWADKNLSHLPKEALDTYPCFVVPRVSDREKHAGVGGEGNIHETVKSIELMAYLVTLFSSEGDTILDSFAGSGTTCLAAALLNRKYIGIELISKHCKIAEQRIEHWQREIAEGGDKVVDKIKRKLESFPAVKGETIKPNKEEQSLPSKPAPEFFAEFGAKSDGVSMFEPSTVPSPKSTIISPMVQSEGACNVVRHSPDAVPPPPTHELSGSAIRPDGAGSAFGHYPGAVPPPPSSELLTGVGRPVGAVNVVRQIPVPPPPQSGKAAVGAPANVGIVGGAQVPPPPPSAF